MRVIAASSCVVAALVAGACSDETPRSPTPVVVTPGTGEDRQDDRSSRVRPVDPRFDDAFWRQFVFDAYAGPGGVTTERTRVYETVPDIYIWTGASTSRMRRIIRDVLPVRFQELTGWPFTGRITEGAEDRRYGNTITMEFPTSGVGSCANATVGPDTAGSSRIRIQVTRWLLVDQPPRIGYCDYEATLVHEFGHALGFHHVTHDTDHVMAHGRSVRVWSSKEWYHGRLAYEVGRGVAYCGWPFSEECFP